MILNPGTVLDSSKSAQKKRPSACEYGNTALGSMEGGEFLYKLNAYQLSNKESVAWG
jgi:hypothetical protein